MADGETFRFDARQQSAQQYAIRLQDPHEVRTVPLVNVVGCPQTGSVWLHGLNEIMPNRPVPSIIGCPSFRLWMSCGSDLSAIAGHVASRSSGSRTVYAMSNQADPGHAHDVFVLLYEPKRHVMGTPHLRAFRASVVGLTPASWARSRAVRPLTTCSRVNHSRDRK